MLLRLLLPDFRVLTSPVEEEGSEATPDLHLEPVHLQLPFRIAPEDDPRLWAWRKALDVIRAHAIPVGTVVLGADTVVVGAQRLLGKPRDSEDAQRMLLELKGKDHYVVTGFTLLCKQGGDLPRTLGVHAVVSRVTMRDYTHEEVAGYVATGEPMDKAGAYAVQGLGGTLVLAVDGCRLNVVGLPVCEVREMISRMGITTLALPEGGYCVHCPQRETARSAANEVR
jgi:septum formation protein